MVTPQLARSSPTSVEWAEVVLALQLHQNPNAIIPPAGGGGGSAGTYVSQQVLGDLSISYSEYSSAESATSGDCSDCANPEVINKFPILDRLAWVAGWIASRWLPVLA